MTDKYTTS